MTCGAPVAAHAWSPSGSFSDWDTLRGRGPSAGGVPLPVCDLCDAALSGAAFTRRAPTGHSGWFIPWRRGAHAAAIPSGPDGLTALTQPPEPPFRCILGGWMQRRHWWLRAPLALDRAVYPALVVGGSPPGHQVVWIDARRAAALREVLAATDDEAWRLLRGPLPRDAERRTEVSALRATFPDRPGTLSGVLVAVAVARPPRPATPDGDQEDEGADEA